MKKDVKILIVTYDFKIKEIINRHLLDKDTFEKTISSAQESFKKGRANVYLTNYYTDFKKHSKYLEFEIDIPIDIMFEKFKEEMNNIILLKDII